MPYDLLTDKSGLNLRPYQLNAIKAAEKAIIEGKNTALIAMRQAQAKQELFSGMIYRFLKTERFRKYFFLLTEHLWANRLMMFSRKSKSEKLLTIDDIYNVKGLER